MSSKIDLTGQRFGRLVVINEAEPKVFPNGKTQTISQWTDELGIKRKTLQARIKDYHWSIEKALTTPIGKHERRLYGIKN